MSLELALLRLRCHGFIEIQDHQGKLHGGTRGNLSGKCALVSVSTLVSGFWFLFGWMGFRMQHGTANSNSTLHATTTCNSFSLDECHVRCVEDATIEASEALHCGNAPAQ